MISSTAQPAASKQPDHSDGVHLRVWFIGFVLWLIALTATARWGLGEMDRADSPLGWAAWVLAGYAFYLSLCCSFFPAPTSWVVLLVASDVVSAHIGLLDNWAARLAVTASVGALATGLANLNEYHIFTYLLRHRSVARVRDTRLYRWAADWFRTSPFSVIVLFSFVPIPVDVVRWLAITERYPRPRFFAAYFIGRWFRYALLAAAAVGLHLTPWHIALIQGALVVAVGVRLLPRLIRRKQGPRQDLVP